MVKGSKGVRKGAFVVGEGRVSTRAKVHVQIPCDPTILCANFLRHPQPFEPLRKAAMDVPVFRKDPH